MLQFFGEGDSIVPLHLPPPLPPMWLDNLSRMYLCNPGIDTDYAKHLTSQDQPLVKEERQLSSATAPTKRASHKVR